MRYEKLMKFHQRIGQLAMMPDAPGKAKALDLAEAATDPYSLANRVLATAHPTERALRLRALAQGWRDPETSAEWARQNLSGADKAVFYSQVGYWLADRQPERLRQCRRRCFDCVEPQVPDRGRRVAAELRFGSHSQIRFAKNRAALR